MSLGSIDRLPVTKDSEPALVKAALPGKGDADVNDLRSPGRSLPPAAIDSVNASRFKYDFSCLKLHTAGMPQIPSFRQIGLRVQRSPLDESDSCPTCPEAIAAQNSAVAEPDIIPASSEAVPSEESAPPEVTPAAALILEDSAEELRPGQMRKSQFLARLRAAVSRAVDAALAETGRNTEGCPYLTYWFDFYSRQDSVHIERTIRRYAPETAGVASAGDYIPIIAQKASQSATVWASTGELTGVPEGVSINLPGEPPVQSGGGAPAANGTVMAKTRNGSTMPAHDPQAIQNKLGEGHHLEGSVRSRMESAFGMDFSHVRTHTDVTADGLSGDLKARAFTVGKHVAFGAGEYQPGTMIGDALLAHELAHVVQQGGSAASVAPMTGGDAGYNNLEADADRSAESTLASLWGKSNKMLKNLSRNVIPSLRSGLQLQRCSSGDCPPGYHWTVASAVCVSSVLGVGASSCKWRCVQDSSGQPGIRSNRQTRPLFLPEQTTSGPCNVQGTCVCNPPTDDNGNPYTSSYSGLCDVLGGPIAGGGRGGRQARGNRPGSRRGGGGRPVTPRTAPPTPAPRTPAPPTPAPPTPAPRTAPTTVPPTPAPRTASTTTPSTPAPPTRRPGEGITYQGRIQWGNPASRPAYGHSRSEHGAQRPASELRDRARSRRTPQGQFSNDQIIVEAEQRAPLRPGAHDIDMGRAVGRVYMPDGSVIESVTRVRIVRRDDLRVDTSFPIQ